jgi:hypothetical protein
VGASSIRTLRGGVVPVTICSDTAVLREQRLASPFQVDEPMTDLGKVLLVFGLLLVVVGLLLVALGNFSGRGTWIGRLPGDILIQRGNWTFYFPLATSLLVSVLLTLLFSFFNRR